MEIGTIPPPPDIPGIFEDLAVAREDQAPRRESPEVLPDKPSLEECERIIELHHRSFIEAGKALNHINEHNLYEDEGFETFKEYAAKRLELDYSTVNEYIRMATTVEEMTSAIADVGVPPPNTKSHVKALVSASNDIRVKAWRRAYEKADRNLDNVTAKLVEESRNEVEREAAQRKQADVLDDMDFDLAPYIATDFEPDSREQETLIVVPEALIGSQLRDAAVPAGGPISDEKAVPLRVFDGKPPLDEILEAYQAIGATSQFNAQTNESINWAKYSWNPMTGCLHNCFYCYAAYIAKIRYKQDFQPTIHPKRLLAPAAMPSPSDVEAVAQKNVFVCAMADLFGKWVPDWFIWEVLKRTRKYADFNYLFLTKFPQKLSRFEFPDNAWIGTTVDTQARVSVAEKYFENVEASWKWISAEHLLESLTFERLSIFDCIVVGAQTGYGSIPERQPGFEWVIDLYDQAREANCMFYWKDNLRGPKELPRQLDTV